jgi:hypothetical protein
MLSRKIVTWWCAFRGRAQNRSATPPSLETVHTWLMVGIVTLSPIRSV